MKFTHQMPDWKNKGNAPTEELKTTGFVAEDRPPANLWNWFWGLITDAIKEIQTKLTTVDNNKVEKTEIIPVITAYSQLDGYDIWCGVEGTHESDKFSTTFRAKGTIFGGENSTDEALCTLLVSGTGDFTATQTVSVMRGNQIYVYSRIGTYTDDGNDPPTFYLDSWGEFELVDKFAKETDLDPTQEVIGSSIFVSDSANQPLIEMNIYGKSEQKEGYRPSPESPSEITNINTPTVSLCGKNIMKPSGTKTHNGVTLTLGNDGIYTISGTTTGYININLGNAYVVAGQKYKPTIVVYSGSINPSYWNFETQSNMDKDSKGYLSSEVSTKMSAFIYNDTAGVTYDAKFAIMLELVTDEEMGLYKPYEGTDLTIDTPNGLAGIRVSSGGNYTDAEGKQWVCDEIDFARGVYIQRCYTFRAETIANLGTTANNRVSVNLPYSGLPYNVQSALCSHFEYKPTVYSDSGNDVGFVVSNKTLFFRFGSNSVINTPTLAQEWLDNQASNGKPLTVHYILETPIETPLTDDQIAAYKALLTYNPYTTIVNDGGANMKVRYVKKSHNDFMQGILDRTEEIKLLWENASVNSSFSKQTITLASGDYDFLIVTTVDGMTMLGNKLGLKNANITGFYSAGNPTNLTFYKRGFSLTDETTLLIGDSTSQKVGTNNTITSGTANDTAIPYQVLGVKL
jgi:hypothetical protein